MASTTTNYGFDVPTSSDLVKNGATAISTLGQDLDTFLFRPFSRNVILNSSFQVWQRGTSFTGNTYTTYSADRWNAYRNGVGGSTFSRQATNDTTNLPNIQYCMRVQRDSGNTSTQYIQLAQSLESVNSIPLAGKQVTVSYYARAGANFSGASSQMSVALQSGTGTDQSITQGYTGNVNIISQTQAITTTWTRYTVTATVGTGITELGLQFYYLPVGTASTNDYFEITGVQLEVGNQASPYAPANATIQGELAACQRYYYRNAPATSGVTFGQGSANGSRYVLGVINLPVSMRIAPTSAEFSALTATDGATAGSAVAALAAYGNSTTTATYYFDCTSGLTQYRNYKIETSSSSGYIGFSAEL